MPRLQRRKPYHILVKRTRVENNTHRGLVHGQKKIGKRTEKDSKGIAKSWESWRSIFVKMRGGGLIFHGNDLNKRKWQGVIFPN